MLGCRPVVGRLPAPGAAGRTVGRRQAHDDEVLEPIVALLQPFAKPTPTAAADPAAHLRRCTYRRLIAVRKRPAALYEAECLYPDRQVPIPLGDLASARPICASCTASHVFRPDED